MNPLCVHRRSHRTFSSDNQSRFLNSLYEWSIQSSISDFCISEINIIKEIWMQKYTAVVLYCCGYFIYHGSDHQSIYIQKDLLLCSAAAFFCWHRIFRIRPKRKKRCSWHVICSRIHVSFILNMCWILAQDSRDLI